MMTYDANVKDQKAAPVFFANSAVTPLPSKAKTTPFFTKPGDEYKAQLIKRRLEAETKPLNDMTDEQKQDMVKQIMASQCTKGKYADIASLEEVFTSDNLYFKWYVGSILLRQDATAARLLNQYFALGLKF